MRKATKNKKGNAIGFGYFELDELITRILCDTAPRHKVDAAYLFSETVDNEASVLKAAVFLYGLGPVNKLAVAHLGRKFGYPGFRSWVKKLVAMGVPQKDVRLIPLAKDFPPSTDAEALGLVRYAKAKGWKSIYVVAPPLHQLRAFITTVSHAMKEKSDVKVYSFPGIPQSWEEHVVHSQGIQKGTRSELLAKELEKIERYYREGDLVSGEEVLGYLNKRDKES
ncbi:MAG: YdcF family protein [Candidatus Liptonbacteria bacterium]|nr:YdcF family protein [Parcubacteria group bacterium]MBI4087343.1 YdcF family protein [Candidatus Liptonbacteria bacterium]